MTPDELTGVTTSLRLVGLTVVARLAARHGVKVELQASDIGGIIANVTLPAQVVRSKEESV